MFLVTFGGFFFGSLSLLLSLELMVHYQFVVTKKKDAAKKVLD